MKRERRNAVGLTLMSLAFLLIGRPAHARRAYFMGALSYNDNTQDAKDADNFAKPETAGVCDSSDGFLHCYKLLSCSVVISNLSPSAQDIVAYNMTLHWTYTNIRESSALSLYDPFVRDDGSIQTWSGSTTNIRWTAGSALPFDTLFKFSHSDSSSLLLPQSGSPSFVRLDTGQSAHLILGGVKIVGGGNLQYSTDASLKRKATKTLGTCFGYVDVTDADTKQPGFVLASGTLESKAGSSLNPTIIYGGRPTKVAPSPTPSVGVNSWRPDASSTMDDYMQDWPSTSNNEGSPRFSRSQAMAPVCSNPADPIRYILYYDMNDTYDGSPDFTADYLNYDTFRNGGKFNIPNNNLACAVSPAPSGVKFQVNSANFPEIIYNVPITINGGSPF